MIINNGLTVIFLVKFSPAAVTVISLLNSFKDKGVLKSNLYWVEPYGGIGPRVIIFDPIILILGAVKKSSDELRMVFPSFLTVKFKVTGNPAHKISEIFKSTLTFFTGLKSESEIVTLEFSLKMGLVEETPLTAKTTWFKSNLLK